MYAIIFSKEGELMKKKKLGSQGLEVSEMGTNEKLVGKALLWIFNG